MNKRTQTYLFFVLLLAALLRPLPVSAQSVTASDLIAAVNALRASQNLEPYRVDEGLMSYAQGHANYLAEIRQGTHVHRDGSLPWDIGLGENVASGDVNFMSVAFAVNQIWSDAVHMKPMVGYTSGGIGAGIAVDAGGQVYYVIDVRADAAAPPTNPDPKMANTSAVPLAAKKEAAFTPNPLSTPLPDGSIKHTVKDGETLWSIAVSYGVTVAQLRDLNGMADDATEIYTGQTLLVRLAFTVTPTSPVTETPAASATPEPTQTAPAEAAPVEAASPTPALSATPSAPPPEGQRASGWITLAVAAVAAGLGLIVGLWFGRRRSLL